MRSAAVNLRAERFAAAGPSNFRRGRTMSWRGCTNMQYNEGFLLGPDEFSFWEF